MIYESVLKEYHAALLTLNKGDVLFHEGDPATSFYVVKTGKIKMVNVSSEGREFVLGYFTDGQSFGEPPFFARVPYPAAASATEKSVVWKLGYENFLTLLKNNFDVHMNLMRVLSERLIYKSTMLSEIAIEEAEHRLVTLIRYLLEQRGPAAAMAHKLSFTRQQLADMTGLRVETVIRSIKSLEQKRLLEIDDDGKIVWKTPVK